MKKLMLVLGMVVLLVVGCTSTMRNIEKKHDDRKFSDVIECNHDLDTVYAVVNYVLLHTESCLFYSVGKSVEHEENVIWLYGWFGSPCLGMSDSKVLVAGIFFVSQGESKTRIEFPEGSGQHATVSCLADEIRYCLDNGREKYKEYTWQRYLEEQEKLMKDDI